MIRIYNKRFVTLFIEKSPFQTCSFSRTRHGKTLVILTYFVHFSLNNFFRISLVIHMYISYLKWKLHENNTVKLFNISTWSFSEKSEVIWNRLRNWISFRVFIIP